MFITAGDFAGKYIWKVLQAIAQLKKKFLIFYNDPVVFQSRLG